VALDPEISRQHIAELCCGPVNKGVTLYKGKVYAGPLDGTVVALDQNIWEGGLARLRIHSTGTARLPPRSPL